MDVHPPKKCICRYWPIPMCQDLSGSVTLHHLFFMPWSAIFGIRKVFPFLACWSLILPKLQAKARILQLFFITKKDEVMNYQWTIFKIKSPFITYQKWFYMLLSNDVFFFHPYNIPKPPVIKHGVLENYPFMMFHDVPVSQPTMFDYWLVHASSC